MGAARELVDKKVLRNLVPLNSLSQIHFKEVTKNAVIEDISSGSYIFQEGKRDSFTFYVLSGEISIINGRKVVASVSGGSKQSKQPLPNEQPRKYSARAKTKATVMRIDTSLLDVLLDWDQSGQYEVTEIQADDDEDWMTKMLKSELFSHIPAQNIQKMIMHMEEIRYKAGESVLQQNEEGDCYYIIKSGHCVVSKQTGKDAKPVLIAELRDGDSFGEEALLNDGVRNASVTMITDGTLMRLSKVDFQELLQNTLVTKVNLVEALALIKEGAKWLDVQSEEAHKKHALPNSISIPIGTLRASKEKLDVNEVYIIYCTDGTESASAVFLLGQYGYDSVLLDGGLKSISPRELKNLHDQNKGADVISLVSDSASSKAEPISISTKRTAKRTVKRESKRALKPVVEESTEKEFAKSVKRQAVSSKSSDELLLKEKTNQSQIIFLRNELDKANLKITRQETDIETISSEKEKLASRVKDFANKAVSKHEEMNGDVDDLHKQLEEMQYEHDLERKNLEKEIKNLNRNVAKAETFRSETKELKEEVKELERIQVQAEEELEDLRGSRDQEQSVGKQVESEALLEMQQAITDANLKVKEGTAEREKLEKQLIEIKSLHKSEDTALSAELVALREDVKRIEDEKKLSEENASQYLVEKTAIEKDREEDEHVRASLLAQQNSSGREAKEKVESLEVELESVQTELNSSRNVIDQLTKVAQESVTKTESDEEKKTFLETIQNHQGKIQTLEQRNKEMQELMNSSETNIEKLKNQKSKIEFDWQAAEKARTGLIEQYDGDIKKLEENNVRIETQLETERKNSKDLNLKLKSSLEDRDKQIEKLDSEFKIAKQERDLLKKDLSSSKSDQSKLSKTESKLGNVVTKLEKSIEKRDVKITEANELLVALEQEKASIEEAKLDAQKEKKSADKEWGEKLEKQTSDYHASKYRNEQLETEINLLKTDYEQASKRLSEFETERDDLYEQVKDAEHRGIEQSTASKEVKTLMREMKVLEKDNKKSQNASKTRLAELDTTVSSLQEDIRKYRDLQSILEEKNRELEEDVIGVSNLQSRFDDREKEFSNLKRKFAQSEVQLEASRKESRSKQENPNENDQAFYELQKEQLELKDELEELQKRNQQLDRERSVYEGEISNLKKADKTSSEDSVKLKGALKRKAEDENTISDLKSEIAMMSSAHAETANNLHQTQSALKETEHKMQKMGDELKGSNGVSVQVTAMKAKFEDMKRDTKDKIRQHQYEYESMVTATREENKKLRVELQRIKKVALAQSEQQVKVLAKAQSSTASMGVTNVMDLDLPPEPNDPYAPLDIADIPQAPGPNEQRFEVPDIVQQSDFGRSEFPTSEFPTSEFQHSGRGESVPFPTETFGERTQVHFVSDNDAKKSFSFAKLIGGLIVASIFAGAAYWYFDIYPKEKRAAARIDAKTKNIVPKIQNKNSPVSIAKKLEKVKIKPKPVVKEKPKVVKKIIVKPGKTFQDKLRDETVGPYMVQIPKARFMMGSNNNALEANEKPRHRVRLKRYSISKYEVTFAEYMAFAKVTDRRIPEDEWGQVNRPIINVSWKDAVAYTKWLSEQTGYVYRLPTEAEWEYAARAGTNSDYHWGNNLGSNRANCFDCGSQWDSSKTAPIGSFKANRFGLYDMLGNVMEWTMDCFHSSYKGAPSKGGAWLTGTCKTRVLRGGSFKNTDDQIRSFSREHASQDTINKQIGFRVVREQ